MLLTAYSSFLIILPFTEDLFYSYGVDLVLSSSSQFYQRSWPVYKYRTTRRSYVNPTAPVYLDNGNKPILAKLKVGLWSAKQIPNKNLGISIKIQVILYSLLHNIRLMFEY